MYLITHLLYSDLSYGTLLIADATQDPLTSETAKSKMTRKGLKKNTKEKLNFFKHYNFL